MSGLPSLPPPMFTPPDNKCSDLLDIQVLESKEKEYKEWVASYQECPYHSAAGVKQTDYEDTELDIEEDESLEESDIDELNGDNDTSMFEESVNAYVEDSESSMQDVSPINEST